MSNYQTRHLIERGLEAEWQLRFKRSRFAYPRLDDSLMRFVQSCKPGAPALKRLKSELLCLKKCHGRVRGIMRNPKNRFCKIEMPRSTTSSIPNSLPNTTITSLAVEISEDEAAWSSGSKVNFCSTRSKAALWFSSFFLRSHFQRKFVANNSFRFRLKILKDCWLLGLSSSYAWPLTNLTNGIFLRGAKAAMNPVFGTADGQTRRPSMLNMLCTLTRL